jgi:hypothetical protein
MKVSGYLVEHMAKVFLLTLKVKFMMDNGRTIKPMATVRIFMSTVLNMKDCGIKICNKARVQRTGQMDQYSQGNIEKGRKMDSENISGMTEQVMKENGLIMKYQDSDTINGLMAENTLAIGEQMSWMISECTSGKMVECMKDSTRMIRNTATVYIHGQIKRNMQGGGAMVNSMVSGYLFPKMVKRS